MPKKYRLSHADFLRLPRSGRRVHGNYFSLSIAHPPLLKGPRAACVVQKKVATRAVDRNRIERACREALRPLMKAVTNSAAFIFHAKREARGATNAQLADDIRKLLRSVEQATMPTQ